MNPDSTGSEDAPLEVELPGWMPSRRGRLDPLDPEATTVEAPMTASDVDVDQDDELQQLRHSDEWIHPSSTSTSEPGESLPPFEPTSRIPSGSSRGSIADPTIAAACAEAIAPICGALGMILDRTVGRGSRAWLMRPEEADAIATPLGRIAARHVPVGAGEASDVADGIEAGIAAAGYAVRATVEQYAGPESAAGEAVVCSYCRGPLRVGESHHPQPDGTCHIATAGVPA